MKKVAFLVLVFLGLLSHSQTPLYQNTMENIWAGNSASCTTTGPGTIHNNSFIRVFDTDNYPIQDTAFFLYIEFAVQETSGGAYNLIGRVHKLDGVLAFSNMTLIADDTAAVYPDSSIYKLQIPFTEGYALPGDTLVVEVFAPLNGSIIFFPGSNPYLETGPSYIAASGCGLVEPTPFADIGFTDVKLILKLWVNQKPALNQQDYSMYKNDVVLFNELVFESAMQDPDADTITMLRVATLPANGVLQLNSVPVSVGDTIYDNEINLLTYAPNTGFVGIDHFTMDVKDNYHWSNTSGDCYVNVIDWQVGLDEKVVNTIELFPNPSSDKLYVRSVYPIVSYRVVDQSGREVQVIYDSNNVMDISPLEAGVYYLIASDNYGVNTLQFIKL